MLTIKPLAMKERLFQLLSQVGKITLQMFIINALRPTFWSSAFYQEYVYPEST
jgi:hypothetical protein